MTEEDEADAAIGAQSDRSARRQFCVGRIAMRQLRSRPAPTIAQGLTLAAAITLGTGVLARHDRIAVDLAHRFVTMQHGRLAGTA